MTDIYPEEFNIEDIDGMTIPQLQLLSSPFIPCVDYLDIPALEDLSLSELEDLCIGLLPFIATGGIAFGGIAGTAYNIFIDQDITWNTYVALDVDLSILWDIESNVKYWFRIESECSPPSIATTGTEWNDPSCGQTATIQGQQGSVGNKYIQIVPAKSLKDLCSLISEPKPPFWTPTFKWKIKSIKRYNLTVQKSDLPNGEIPDYVELIEQDFKNIPECMPFNLLTPDLPNVVIGVVTSGIDTFYNYVASGGISLGGNASTQGGDFFNYAGSGGFVLSGTAGVVSPVHSYTAQGGIGFEGDAPVSSSQYNYIASGGIGLEGTNTPFLVDYHYEANGGIGVGGGAECSTDWGISEFVTAGATVSLLLIEGGFVLYESTSTGLNIDNVEVALPCDCGYMPLKLTMFNDWARTGILSDFLRRNAISFPDRMDLLYRNSDTTWNRNLHYTGWSNQANEREQWTLIFQWSCVDTIGGNALIDDMWQYSSQIFRKNLTTGKSVHTRMIFAMEKEKACIPGRIDATFSVDTGSGIVVANEGDILDYTILYDGIGLFGGSQWNKNPYLNINISEVGAFREWPKIDIAPIFPAALFVP